MDRVQGSFPNAEASPVPVKSVGKSCISAALVMLELMTHEHPADSLNLGFCGKFTNSEMPPVQKTMLRLVINMEISIVIVIINGNSNY